MTTNAKVPTKLYFEDVQVGDAIPKLVKGLSRICNWCATQELRRF